MSTEKNFTKKEKTKFIAFTSIMALVIIIIISFASFNIGKN